MVTTSRLFTILVLCIIVPFAMTLSARIAAAQVYSADGTPVLIGARSVPKGLNLCNDYASRTDYSGAPYRVVEPDRVVTRHEGMDFCAPAGTPVIAPVAGTIAWSIQDHPLRGGQVLIKTQFRVKAEGNRSKPVYIGMVHIRPDAKLRRGSRVKPGQLIGQVQKAGLVEIGSRSHVHFTARVCDETHKCHFDPNFLWSAGPGKVSCYKDGMTLPKGKIVAPVLCR